MTTDVYFGRKVATTGAAAVLEALSSDLRRPWKAAPRAGATPSTDRAVEAQHRARHGDGLERTAVDDSRRRLGEREPPETRANLPHEPGGMGSVASPTGSL